MCLRFFKRRCVGAGVALLIGSSLHAQWRGDCDFDGDVDLADYLTFAACFTGPGSGLSSPECACADADGDRDVDLADAVSFQGHYGGFRTRYFPRTSIWYQDVSSAPVDAQSAEIIAWLERAGGWGTGTMRVDFSIEVLRAGPDAPLREFIPTEDHFLPHCDIAPVPVPAGGALEGEAGYACLHDGDCHLIVVHEPTQRLFEMWRANFVDDAFLGGCLAVWDMTRVYGPRGRGENCTSADAAGLPIAPLLFTADEVAAGVIDHAVRFVLPNARIRRRVYVRPATHSTSATRGPTSAPPYGARFRLRAGFPLETLPNEGARVVARALQRYGMFLADGGQIALTAQSDRLTTARWEGRLEPDGLAALRVRDFEMIEAGPRLSFTGDCRRQP